MGQAWVLLIYTMPREPTAPRVAAWRKLKKLGALRLHDAAWVLPATPATIAHMQWLMTEIQEGHGEASVWHAAGHTPAQDADLIHQFTEQAEMGYLALISTFQQPAVDQAEMVRRYQQIRAIDYFHAPAGDEVRAFLEGDRQ